MIYDHNTRLAMSRAVEEIERLRRMMRAKRDALEIIREIVLPQYDVAMRQAEDVAGRLRNLLQQSQEEAIVRSDARDIVRDHQKARLGDDGIPVSSSFDEPDYAERHPGLVT